MVYLGHIIDSTDLHPSLAKVQAIQKAHAPTNITELKAFLGLVNYYHKFLPNLSSTLSPFHILLCKGTKWNWTITNPTADILPFHTSYTELSVLDGCVLLGCCVIIPVDDRTLF